MTTNLPPSIPPRLPVPTPRHPAGYPAAQYPAPYPAGYPAAQYPTGQAADQHPVQYQVGYQAPLQVPQQTPPNPAAQPNPHLPPEPVRLQRRPNAWWYSVGQVFFFLYVAAIGLLTLLPNLARTAVPNLALRAVNWFGRHGINITISQLEQISNFLMFVPFGILGSLLLAHRLTPRMRLISVRGHGEKILRKGLRIGRAAVIICLLAALYSVGIETVQNMIPGRVSDPRDILLNSGGAVFGALIVTAVIWFFQFLGWTLRVGGSDN